MNNNFMYGYQPNMYGYRQPYVNMPQYNQSPMQPQQPVMQQIGLQGKMVDSLDVVKSAEIPLDGSISYFPLTDKSAIITRQLQSDGTCQTITYKQVVEKETPKINYISEENFNTSIEEIKNQISQLSTDIGEINRNIRGRK